MGLAGCEDSRQPILRGVKQQVEAIFGSPSEDSEQTAEEPRLPPEPESDKSEGVAEPQPVMEVDLRTQETVRRILDLQLPEDLRHGQPQVQPADQWQDQALIGEHQTFPNLFDAEKPQKKESPVDFSGKLHWEPMPGEEELLIPPLNTIEGVEVEITVKTR